MNLKILLVLSFGHFVTDVYQGALPAILPFLKARLDLSYTLSGLLLMVANVTSSVVQPLFGYLSDRKELRSLLPGGCLLAGLGFSLVSVPEHFVPVVLLVALSGLGIALYHPEGYKTAHFYTGPHRAAGMSVFSVGGNLGLALGPVLAVALITRLGFARLPVMFGLSLLFVALLGGMRHAFQAHRTLPQARTSAAAAPAPGARRSLACLIAAVIMRSWTQLGLMTYIPFYFHGHLGVDPLQAGALVSAFLLGGVAGSVAGAVAADRYGYRRCLRLSLLGGGLLLPLVLVAAGVWLYLALTLAGLVLISSFTVSIVMAQRLLPRHLGVASGLMVGFAIGAGGVGVTLLGVVADALGVDLAFKAILVLPWLGFGLSLLVGEPGAVTGEPAKTGPS